MQLIPPVLLVTVPVPLPNPLDGAVGATVSANDPVPLLNVAVTVVFAVNVNVHVFDVPLHGLLHEPNADPVNGVSARVIAVPLGNVNVQVPCVTPVVS